MRAPRRRAVRFRNRRVCFCSRRGRAASSCRLRISKALLIPRGVALRVSRLRMRKPARRLPRRRFRFRFRLRGLAAMAFPLFDVVFVFARLARFWCLWPSSWLPPSRAVRALLVLVAVAVVVAVLRGSRGSRFCARGRARGRPSRASRFCFFAYLAFLPGRFSAASRLRRGRAPSPSGVCVFEKKLDSRLKKALVVVVVGFVAVRRRLPLSACCVCCRLPSLLLFPRLLRLKIFLSNPIVLIFRIF